MSDDAWIERNRLGLGEWVRLVAAGNPSSRVFERDRLVAAIVPDAAERSVFNSVVHLDPDALAAARDELAAAYAEAGCAWTVWVPEADLASSRLLEEAGHRLDASPRAMGMELAGIEHPDLSGVEWTAEGDFETACSINDRAYGYRDGTFRDGLGTAPDGTHVYLAEAGGEPAATVMTKDRADDVTIWLVATLEQARGRGLASALMRRALYDAARRGCSTSTLQATRAGAPVYERIGYRDFGALQMWEWRDG
jgi:GNAT superfamily N-acetyltransferase